MLNNTINIVVPIKIYRHQSSMSILTNLRLKFHIIIKLSSNLKTEHRSINFLEPFIIFVRYMYHESYIMDVETPLVIPPRS